MQKNCQGKSVGYSINHRTAAREFGRVRIKAKFHVLRYFQCRDIRFLAVFLIGREEYNGLADLVPSLCLRCETVSSWLRVCPTAPLPKATTFGSPSEGHLP